MRQINEQLFLAKEKEEEASRLKTEFIHNMSHEIRTPMNGIIGFSKMLLEPDITEEERRFFSKIVQNSSHQLLKIIDDILEISEFGTKLKEINESAFCLNTLLKELFAVFNLKHKGSKITLTTKKALHDDHSQIISDKAKITRVLSNLLDNAYKFTKEGTIEFGYFIEKANLVIYCKRHRYWYFAKKP